MSDKSYAILEISEMKEINDDVIAASSQTILNYFSFLRFCTAIIVSKSCNCVTQTNLVNSWHNVWLELLFIDTDSDCNEFNGFHIDPIKAKELHLYAKSVTNNQDIF